MEPLSEIDQFFDTLRSIWDQRLEALTAALTEDPMSDLSLEVTRHVPHAPARVFDAWLDPAMLKRFIQPGEGVTVPEAETDPREGGDFRIVMRTPDGNDLLHRGTYQKIDRPNQLVFTWVSNYTQEDSTVTIDFAAKDDGTDVTLRHVRFPSEESRDNHEGGWTRILETMDGAL